MDLQLETAGPNSLTWAVMAARPQHIQTCLQRCSPIQESLHPAETQTRKFRVAPNLSNHNTTDRPKDITPHDNPYEPKIICLGGAHKDMHP